MGSDLPDPVEAKDQFAYSASIGNEAINMRKLMEIDHLYLGRLTGIKECCQPLTIAVEESLGGARTLSRAVLIVPFPEYS